MKSSEQATKRKQEQTANWFSHGMYNLLHDFSIYYTHTHTPINTYDFASTRVA